ncbi:MAG: type II toxin-antitoxin system VapC family toxin [Deltaproteobacteria bacterium]|nr:type II toxin-antitoxin system VapC family toxin [Deltaproteobacteria bacterium]
MVLLDTCALIELYQFKSSLALRTEDEIAKGAFILSVSFAEIALKEKRGLLKHPKSLDVFQDCMESEEAKIINISVQEWFDAIHLDWKHKDPVDRLIVAYAKRQDVPIVTSDKLIKKYYKNVLW